MNKQTKKIVLYWNLKASQKVLMEGLGMNLLGFKLDRSILQLLLNLSNSMVTLVGEKWIIPCKSSISVNTIHVRQKENV